MALNSWTHVNLPYSLGEGVNPKDGVTYRVSRKNNLKINYFLIVSTQKLYSKVSKLKRNYSIWKPGRKNGGKSCYYSAPQLMVLRQISLIFYRADQPEGHEIKGAQRAMRERVNGHSKSRA
jgi:hypothetical protein